MALYNLSPSAERSTFAVPAPKEPLPLPAIVT